MKFQAGEEVDCSIHNNIPHEWPMWPPCRVIKHNNHQSYLIEDCNEERIWVQSHLLKKMNTQTSSQTSSSAPLPTGTNTDTPAPVGTNVNPTPPLPGTGPQDPLPGVEKFWTDIETLQNYLALMDAKRVDAIDRINRLRAWLNELEQKIRR